MKIKIVYGIDMRLWRYNKTDSEPLPHYANLLEYILKTFEFDDMKQFRITFKDDDDEKITMTSQEDFKDALTYAQKADKKSLKLYIIDTAEPHYFEEKESKEPINNNNNNNNNNNANDANDVNNEPTEEEINAFLSDDLIMDLLSDLFISVFEALQASNFEISFGECISGVILSSNDKYNKLTSSKVWPYFMNTLLPNISHKIDQFMIPMIKMNGINSQMIKQWLPTLFNIMKYHTKNNNNSFCGKWKNKPWKHHRHHRGRRGHHHGHGNHGHHGHHGHHGDHGHHRGGWRGRGRYAYNNQYHPHHANYQNYGYDNRQQNEDDQIEQDVFMYTEELVQIMNMGFKNMNEIKKLLNEHKGDKQLVVQQLVSKQNK